MMSFIHHKCDAVKLSAAGYHFQRTRLVGLRKVRLKTSLLRQRHLRGGSQIRDEIADFVVFEGFEQAFEHHKSTCHTPVLLHK